MQVIKNINNNVSLCLDSTGTQVIAFGKGIGFKRPPYEIGLAEVEKTFYDVDERYVRMIQDIPFEVIETSNDIIEHSKGKLSSRLSPNIVFTLADHISLPFNRAINGMNFDLPIKQDIQHLFPEEAEVGRYAVARIKESLHITLPDEEALYVALHIINGGTRRSGQEVVPDGHKYRRDNQDNRARLRSEHRQGLLLLFALRIPSELPCDASGGY